MEEFRVMDVAPREDEGSATADRLAEAYTRNAPGALRLAYFLTGDPEMAEDLLQDAFVRVFARMRHLHPIDDLDGYLRKTMVNLFTSTLRRKRLERAWLARCRHAGTGHRHPG